MKLLASGCSLIYGSELADERQHNQHSQLTYPALLAKQKNLEYKCVAHPANGNDAIARSIVKNLDETVALVVVNWSYLGRFEFNLREWGWRNFKSHNLYEPISKQTEQLRKYFFSEVTPVYNYYKYLQEIVFVQDYLKVRNIPYIFSTADYDPINYNTISKLDPEHVNLWKAIDFDPWFYWQVNKNPVGFLQWAKFLSLPTGTDGHPLEQAHQMTVDMIQNKVNI